MPAFAVQAVDTTAAGDIFHGALVYAISRQKQIEEALRFASLTASLSVQKAGGRTSIPALHEVTEALACGD
jgi:sugar/nucleoside kinase (ribokinase family)